MRTTWTADELAPNLRRIDTRGVGEFISVALITVIVLMHPPPILATAGRTAGGALWKIVTS